MDVAANKYVDCFILEYCLMIIPASSCTPLGNDVISANAAEIEVLFTFDKECHSSAKCGVTSDSVPAKLRVLKSFIL